MNNSFFPRNPYIDLRYFEICRSTFPHSQESYNFAENLKKSLCKSTEEAEIFLNSCTNLAKEYCCSRSCKDFFKEIDFTFKYLNKLDDERAQRIDDVAVTRIFPECAELDALMSTPNRINRSTHLVNYLETRAKIPLAICYRFALKADTTLIVDVLSRCEPRILRAIIASPLIAKLLLEKLQPQQYDLLMIKDRNNQTMLHHAVHAHATELIQLLLTSATPERLTFLYSKDNDNKTPLEIAFTSNLVYTSDHHALFTLLLEKTSPEEKKEFFNKKKPLYAAAMLNNTELLELLLLFATPEDLIKRTDNMTFLMLLTEEGNNDAVNKSINYLFSTYPKDIRILAMVLEAHLTADSDENDAELAVWIRTFLQNASSEERAAFFAIQSPSGTILQWAIFHHPEIVQLLLTQASERESAALFDKTAWKSVPLKMLLERATTPDDRISIFYTLLPHLQKYALPIPLKLRYLALLPPSYIKSVTEASLPKWDALKEIKFVWDRSTRTLRSIKYTLPEVLQEACRVIKEVIPAANEIVADTYRLDLRQKLQTLPSQALALAAHHHPEEVASLFTFFDASQITAVVPQLKSDLLATTLQNLQEQQEMWPQILAASTSTQKEELLKENLLHWPKDEAYYMDMWNQALSHKKKLSAENFAAIHAAPLQQETHPCQIIDKKIAHTLCQGETSEVVQEITTERLHIAELARKNVLAVIQTWLNLQSLEKEIPEEFLDSITCELMNDPHELPGNGEAKFYVDKSSLARLAINNDPNMLLHPFTRSPFPLTLALPAAALQHRIREWHNNR